MQTRAAGMAAGTYFFHILRRGCEGRYTVKEWKSPSWAC